MNTALLAVGDQLPPLQLQTSDGRAVDTAGTVLLYFMRTADCAVCKNHVRRLAKRDADLRAAGASVVVVVPDGPDAALDLQERLGLPFPVVAGDGAHGRLGMVPKVLGQLQQSGTIVVKDGRIVHLKTATVPLRALDEDAALAAAGVPR